MAAAAATDRGGCGTVATGCRVPRGADGSADVRPRGGRAMSWKQRIAAAGLGAALALVVQFEGKVNRAYLDPVGKPTICYGHTGPEVHLSMVATDEQCEPWAAEGDRKSTRLKS